MTLKDRNKKYQAKFREVQGFRLIVDWVYFDPYLGDLVIVKRNTFLTQPFTRGPFRSFLFLGRELLVPRAVMRRAKTNITKELADDLLLGKCLPTHAVYQNDKAAE